MKIESVSSLYFFFQLVWNRDIHATIKIIMEVYKAKSFKVGIPLTGKTLYILQEAQLIKPVLHAKTELGSVNEHFNLSHGHFLSINGLNMEDPLWKLLHQKLTHLFNKEKIDYLMEENWQLLFPSGEFYINDTLKEFLAKILSEYFFGSHLSREEYQQLQTEITEYVKLTFHNASVNRLPFIGKLFCSLNYYRYKDKVESIDKKIDMILEKSLEDKTGMFFHLYEELQDVEDVKRVIRDNIFLSFLVYDFVYKVALDFFVQTAQGNANRKEVAEQSLERGFLFPFRFRVAKEEIGEIKPDDLCILNLKAAKLYFSYGPRTCSGQGLYQNFMKTLLNRIENDIITQVSDEPIVYANDPDIPTITSRHKIKVLKK